MGTLNANITKQDGVTIKVDGEKVNEVKKPDPITTAITPTTAAQILSQKPGFNEITGNLGFGWQRNPEKVGKFAQACKYLIESNQITRADLQQLEGHRVYGSAIQELDRKLKTG